MGWDEPVSDSAVYLPYSGRRFKQQLTGRMLAESRAYWQEPNKNDLKSFLTPHSDDPKGDHHG
jgi:hypothetical protein